MEKKIFFKKKNKYNNISYSYLFSENIKYLEYLLNKNIKIKNKIIKKNIKKNILFSQIKKLINNYRNYGFKKSNINPLIKNKCELKKLNLNFYKFKKNDFEKKINIKNIFLKKKKISLYELYNALNKIYSKFIGIEFLYINNKKETSWLQKKFEKSYKNFFLSKEKKINILKKLIAAEEWEIYLSKKFIGQKRFSLEGAESIIPLLDEIIFFSLKKKIKKIVIGMSHRGRLNTLVNILGKKPKDIFNEFNEIFFKNTFEDVKYHKGFSSKIFTSKGNINLYLSFNPSHLEVINPVVEGITRALMNKKKENILPILIHGDAAFSGQGIVMETFNLSQTKNYTTNGTIHIIINNQIGFTTSKKKDSRSNLFCTDIAKMIEAPVLHINVEDLKSIILGVQIAINYKIKFKKDIILDIICFRKLGHNEQDTPSLTQPLMYEKINKHIGIKNLYINKLINEKIISKQEVNKITNNYKNLINFKKKQITGYFLKKKSFMYSKNWGKFLNKKQNNNIITSIEIKKIKELSKKITTIPKKFKLHNLVKKLITNRILMSEEKKKVDWGMSEHLAYASLLISGYNIRLSGQDSERGTFSHRHAVIHDQNIKKYNNGEYIPLQNIDKNQSKFEIINSTLSEEAILGFEYGFSLVEPNNLTIWEAQFGDFSNVAQVIIDQFISSGEKKWGLMSGIILMLPHGFEGQGPEHSSARLERFLQLCSKKNLQIIQPTTSKQLFHLLRRQIIGNFRKPLILMMPKSLLRNENSNSYLKELSNGKFENIIKNKCNNNIDNITNIIICSGKIYFDIIKKNKKYNLKNIFIIRIEQLYPFPKKDFFNIINKVKNLKKIIWVQEEPKNQGAWLYIKEKISKKLKKNQKILYIGRSSNASTATGYYKQHCLEQKKILKKIFLKK